MNQLATFIGYLKSGALKFVCGGLDIDGPLRLLWDHARVAITPKVAFYGTLSQRTRMQLARVAAAATQYLPASPRYAALPLHEDY